MIFLRTFRSTEDLPIAFIVYTNGYEDSDILDFSTPAALKVNAIDIDVRVIFCKRAGTPFFDVFIGSYNRFC